MYGQFASPEPKTQRNSYDRTCTVDALRAYGLSFMRTRSCRCFRYRSLFFLFFSIIISYYLLYNICMYFLTMMMMMHKTFKVIKPVHAYLLADGNTFFFILFITHIIITNTDFHIIIKLIFHLNTYIVYDCKINNILSFLFLSY